MKKIAAILLIAILSFNWYGYRIVTIILARNADKQLEVRLDNDQYNESELIEIRVALNVPYQNDQADFERHYGEMEVNGQYYTYVKRKIENGYLVLKCILTNLIKSKIVPALLKISGASMMTGQLIIRLIFFPPFSIKGISVIVLPYLIYAALFRGIHPKISLLLF